MNIQSYYLFLSTFLVGATSICPPVGDSYTISIPQYINLDNSGQFEISVVESNISENDSIQINIDNNFVLVDSHGKGTIDGRITNGNIVFTNESIEPKTIYYEIDDAGAGDWRGQLNVFISMNRNEEEANSSYLIDGPSINSILKQLNPSVITFSHNNYTEDYLYDLSSDNDESIILYMDGDNCIITNKNDKQIIANSNMSHLFDGLSLQSINNINYIDMSSCEDLSYAFNGITNCTNIIGIELLDVSNVVNFSHLFYGDINLVDVPNIQEWHISDKCTDISYMMGNVSYTPSLANSSKWPENFDLSNWDVSNVKDMSYAFENAFGLKTLNLSNWNTSNLENMEAMFKMKDSNEISKLERIIGIEDFDASKITSLSYTFYDCRYLSEDNDFSTWIPSSLKELSYAFYNTKSLDLRDFENWNQYYGVTSRKMKQCFGADSGHYVDQNYRPSWYK